MSVEKHIKEHAMLNTLSGSALTSAIKSKIDVLKPIKTPLRELNPDVAGVPWVITSGAATSMAVDYREIILGYGNSRSLFNNTCRRHTDPLTRGTGLSGDNITINKALTTFSASTSRILFMHSGQNLELEFSAATTNVFWLKVDGEYESLTPISESNAFRKYNFGSVANRKIEIIAGGNNVASFNFKTIFIDKSDTVAKTELAGPTTVLVSDSFLSGPRAFSSAFADALGWDDVIASGVSQTGYVTDASGASPTFGERLQHDVIDLAPDVVGFVGSVNDDGIDYATLYAAALDVFNRTKAALPNAIIFASNTGSDGVDGQLPNKNRARQAKKDAAAASGIIWIDPTELPVNFTGLVDELRYTSAISATNFTIKTGWGSSASQGIVGSVLSTGDAEAGTEQRRYIKSTAQNGAYTQCNFDEPLTIAVNADDPIVNVGNSYLIGTGDVGSPTGYGNADLLVSDGTHPSGAGHDVLGALIAQLLINKIHAL